MFPPKRRWLRTRLLAAVPVSAEPGGVNDAVADVLAALPGDVCLIVTGWLSASAAAAGRDGVR